MRAAVFDQYGPADVLRLAVVEQPVPADDEVLIKVHATTVSRTNCGLRSAEYAISRVVTGLRRPKPQMRILGTELAGEVAAVGAGVSELAVGDRVFGAPGLGAHTQFVCMRESDALAQMPASMSFEEASAVCDGASLALACLRQADLGRCLAIWKVRGAMAAGWRRSNGPCPAFAPLLLGGREVPR